MIDAVLAEARQFEPTGETAIITLAREDLSGQVLPNDDLFIERCFEWAPLDGLVAAGPAALGRLAGSLFSWVQTRRRGELKFRLVNPEPDGAAESESGSSMGDWTVVEIVTDDMPFLVDSVTAAFSRHELTVHLALHPQFSMRRDAGGRLLEIVHRGLEGDDIVEESVMHFQIDRVSAPKALVDLETELRNVLTDVRTAVEEWAPMRQAAAGVIDRLAAHPSPQDRDDLNEAVEFLRWVDEDHFTYLGCLELAIEEIDGEVFLRPVEGSGLGLLRRLPLGEKATSDQPIRPAERRFLDSPRLISISKTHATSTVHRNVHMDLIAVKRFDDDGRTVGEIRWLGLFTSRAYSIAASEIPLVRRKVARVINRTRFPPAGHDAKTLRHIVQHYPRDELFQISADDLYHFSLRILELQLRPGPALLVRRDEEERYVSCMVYVPRERHSTELRLRIQAILEQAFGGPTTAFSTHISERPLAQIRFIVSTDPERLRQVDVEEVEARLAEVARSWSDSLRDLLSRQHGIETGLEVWRRYRRAFSNSYQEAFSVEDAVLDLEISERVLKKSEIGLRLYRRPGAAISRMHLRMFELAIPAPLSSILPMLENMGLQVSSEIPFEVRPEGSSNPVWVRDFELLLEDVVVDPESAEKNFEDCFTRVWSGEVENDGFNKLVLRAGLGWRDVVVLRAYCKYLRQTGTAFGQRYIETTLARNPGVARLLVELFHAWLDPSRDPDTRQQTCHDLRRQILRALESVTSRDEDRILFRFLNLILSTLRTNYFQSAADGEPKDYLSLKLDGARVRELPAPRPAYEIFVYSPSVEAVHLRGGKVARGGIRWSDRREDFRTEILGLLKSQMVKNAVIVPVGAKGGFVVKRPPRDRDETQAEAIACYRTMIRGMLDLTDNRNGDEVTPPDAVVRHDGDDPYLVVAADKGTAAFSDIANGVAAEYGFWLGDAFASGGSVGYDHKKMGITARGAWEAVERHFRELGHDIRKEPFAVVGVGDMSGDVFGNGVLLSEQLRLVAAFNHLHIFVDPDPDPAASYAERRRLFELPRSSWTDYRTTALSPGGEIFDRHAKEITVASEVQDRFGLGATTLAPDELIRAILKAKVDLLWFGGIGTFVKASAETNIEVGDHANDELRVDAAELGCRVIGEGANLGVTQRGRIEFALAGGRVNTDFIDNSGGVDCSDHEVNIKIALDGALAAGELERRDRDRLLAEMTDEVAELVLHDNYLQTQAITLTEAQKVVLLGEQAQLMRSLEHAGLLDRRLENLPDEETIAERREKRLGLSRPEIAVLLAYSKISLFNQLLDSDLPDDDLVRGDLLRYFPLPMQRRLAATLENHRLRREIIATYVTNSIINRVGPTFLTRLADETGSAVSDIAHAYAAVREIFALRSLWEEIEELDHRVPAELQIHMHLESVQMIERATRWFLRHAGRPLDITGCVARYHSDIITVAAQLRDLLPANTRGLVRRKEQRLRKSGVPPALAKQIASITLQPSACDVARSATMAEVRVERVGKVY
ncbi:MAG: NAD-glutamate dehydrogenase, partial [Thermoanaerobaculia bacterium]